MRAFRNAASAHVIALLIASGCARDVHVRLPTPAKEPVGTVEILLTQPADDLTVSINGNLVAHRAHTKRLRVRRVPIGTTDIIIAAGGGPARIEHHLRVLVYENRTTSIPIGGPSRSMSNSMFTAVLSVVAFVASRAVYLAFF